LLNIEEKIVDTLRNTHSVTVNYVWTTWQWCNPDEVCI